MAGGGDGLRFLFLCFFLRWVVVAKVMEVVVAMARCYMFLWYLFLW